MPQEFKDMGGAATMNPGALQRWLTSRFMSRLVAPQRRERLRARGVNGGAVRIEGRRAHGAHAGRARSEARAAHAA